MLRAMSKVTVAGRAYQHAAHRQICIFVKGLGQKLGTDGFCSVLLGTNDATYNGRVLSKRSVSSLSSTIYLSAMFMVRLYACVRSSPAHSRADSLSRSLRPCLLHFGLGGLNLDLGTLYFLRIGILRNLSHSQSCRRLGKSPVVEVVGP
jgi:hypothetical protein